MRIGERLRCPGYAVVAIETTGLSPHRHRVVELAVATCDLDGTLTEVFTTLLDPEGPVGDVHTHGLFADDVAGAPTFGDIAPHVVELLRERVVVAHNARFDIGFLEREFARRGRPAVPPLTALCTMREAAAYLPDAPRFTLAACCDTAGIDLAGGYGAQPRARATAALLGHYLGQGAGDARHWQQARTVAASLNWPRRRAEGEVPVRTRADAYAARRAREEAERARRRDAVAYLEKCRAGGPPTGVGEDADSYLAVLDAALEDRVITAAEAADLAELAVSLGITEERRRDLDRLYITALAASMVAAGPTIDREERADLVRVAAQLGIARTAVDDIIAMARDLGDHGGTRLLARGRPLQPGQHVLLHGFLAVGQDELERRLARARLTPAAGIHDRVDVVVVADPDEGADRAFWARERGIRVLIEPVFLALLADLERATSTEADAVAHSAAVRTDGRGAAVRENAGAGVRPGHGAPAVGAAARERPFPAGVVASPPAVGAPAATAGAPAAAATAPAPAGVGPAAWAGAGYAVGPGRAPVPPRGAGPAGAEPSRTTGRPAAEAGAASPVPPVPRTPVTTPRAAAAGDGTAVVPRIPPPPTSFAPAYVPPPPGAPVPPGVPADVPGPDAVSAGAPDAAGATGGVAAAPPARAPEQGGHAEAPATATPAGFPAGSPAGPAPDPEVSLLGDAGPEPVPVAAAATTRAVIIAPPGDEPLGEPSLAEASLAEASLAEASVAGPSVAGPPVDARPVAEPADAERVFADRRVADSPAADLPVADPPVAEPAVAESPVADPPVAEPPGPGPADGTPVTAPAVPGEAATAAPDAAPGPRPGPPVTDPDSEQSFPGRPQAPGTPDTSDGEARPATGAGDGTGTAPGAPPPGVPADAPELPLPAQADGPGSDETAGAALPSDASGAGAQDLAGHDAADQDTAGGTAAGAGEETSYDRETGARGTLPRTSADSGPGTGPGLAGTEGLAVTEGAARSESAVTPATAAATAPGGDQAPPGAVPRLTRGQAVTIDALGPHTDALRVEASWAGPEGVDADVVALVLGPDRRVASDDDLVFYNQPVHPGGAVRLAGKVHSGHPGADAVDIDLAALDGNRVLVALALDAPDGTTFAHVPVTVGFVDPVTCRRLAEFRIDGGPETVMILTEVYPRHDRWRLRAVGQGYAEGLAALAVDHGVVVDD